MNQCYNFSELEDSVHMLELERDSLECLVNFSGLLLKSKKQK